MIECARYINRYEWLKEYKKKTCCEIKGHDGKPCSMLSEVDIHGINKMRYIIE